MTVDIVRELGHLTLGTRLKRLGERLQAQTHAVLLEADIGLPSSHLVILAALDRLGPLSVGELTEAVGISQPGISRMVENLRADGLVTSGRPADDRRVRPIVMTESGRQLVARSKRFAWPRVEAAVAEICAGASGSLLAQLSALEEALQEAPLRSRTQRIAERGKKHA